MEFWKTTKGKRRWGVCVGGQDVVDVAIASIVKMLQSWIFLVLGG
jgi:hypothetical protein